ncbi:MAG: hypothetical protein AAF108_05855 [Planctomycetota bacterium]
MAHNKILATLLPVLALSTAAQPQSPLVESFLEAGRPLAISELFRAEAQKQDIFFTARRHMLTQQQTQIYHLFY